MWLLTYWIFLFTLGMLAFSLIDKQAEADYFENLEMSKIGDYPFQKIRYTLISFKGPDERKMPMAEKLDRIGKLPFCFTNDYDAVMWSMTRLLMEEG